MLIDEADLTPTPGKEDYADPQPPHPLLPEPTAGPERRTWVDMMDEQPHSMPEARPPTTSPSITGASSSGALPGRAESKLSVEDDPMASSSGALPGSEISNLQAFQ